MEGLSRVAMIAIVDDGISGYSRWREAQVEARDKKSRDDEE